MKAPSYLALNRHGMYIFRRRVPKDLISHIGRDSIRLSLGTGHLPSAKKMARALTAETDQQFDELTSMNKNRYKLQALISDKKTNISERKIDGIEQNLTKEEITILKTGGAEPTPELQKKIEEIDHLNQKINFSKNKHKESLLKLEIAEEIEADAYRNRLRETVENDYGIAKAKPNVLTGTITATPAGALSFESLLDKYIATRKKDVKKKEVKYTESSFKDALPRMNFWKEHFGKKPVHEISKAELNDVAQWLEHLPIGYTKKKLSVKSAISIAKKGGGDYKTLSPATYNHYGRELRALLTLAHKIDASNENLSKLIPERNAKQGAET